MGLKLECRKCGYSFDANSLGDKELTQIFQHLYKTHKYEEKPDFIGYWIQIKQDDSIVVKHVFLIRM